jgi:hypothetical protein
MRLPLSKIPELLKALGIAPPEEDPNDPRKKVYNAPTYNKINNYTGNPTISEVGKTTDYQINPDLTNGNDVINQSMMDKDIRNKALQDSDHWTPVGYKQQSQLDAEAEAKKKLEDSNEEYREKMIEINKKNARNKKKVIADDLAY